MHLPCRLLTAAALAAALSFGCLKRQTVVHRADRDQELHRGIGAEISTLDPQLATTTSEYAVISALFEGLVTEDPEDLHPVPGVASRWETSPDGTVYTFHLRPDARWSDGSPVTAQDFVQSWRRILTPELGADNANLLYVLQGAEAFNRGLTKDFSSVGAQAVDAATLKVTLEHPAPFFLSLLTHWAWDPVPLATITAAGSPSDRSNRWALPGHLLGNGAFVLKSTARDRVTVVEKSPMYWDAARVRLQAIHLYPTDSLDAEERAFRAGQLHLTDALPAGRVDAYRRDAPQLLRTDPYLGTYFYRCNIKRPYLSDVRIRRALALAVDRKAIVERILRGGQMPAGSFTPAGMDGYVPPETLATDVVAARRLLAEAGYPGGRGLPPFELLYNNSENHRVVAEAIQEMWRRDLGVAVRLVNQESKVVLAGRRTGDFQLMRSDWIADYVDPRSFLDVWRTNSGNNYTGWSSSEYDALLFAASRNPDPAGRHALWAKAENLLLKAAPIIPIYHYTHVFLIRPSVQGWHSNLLDHHPYKYVWLKPGE